MQNEFSQEHTNRLDVEMLKRGISRSRSSALDQIKRGNVSVNGKKILKPSQTVIETDRIDLFAGEKFVSRAGEKLAHALQAFHVSPAGLCVLDIGSSTGGFTDCLLKNNATKVIALDVGTEQLVRELRDDPRVEVHEGTNIRTFTYSNKIDLIVIDVSFISLTHVLPKAFELVKNNGDVIALVKPQFEVGMELAKKYEGIIKDARIQKEVLDRIVKETKIIGFKFIDSSPSPIEGEKGNKEFLIHLKKAI